MRGFSIGFGLIGRLPEPCDLQPGPHVLIALSVAAIAFDGVRAHGHRARMHGAMRSGFAVRKFFPALRFTQPVPFVLDVKRSPVTTQQFHLATAYSVIHGHLPVDLMPDDTPADAEAALNRRGSFESALSLMREATV
jgi:hypothetical protein